MLLCLHCALRLGEQRGLHVLRFAYRVVTIGLQHSKDYLETMRLEQAIGRVPVAGESPLEDLQNAEQAE